MAKNEKQEWITTKIPKDIADEIEILIKNRKLGYNSKTGFVSDALREKIDQLSGKSKKQQTKLEDKIDKMKDVFAKFYSSEDEEPGQVDKINDMNDEIIMIKNMLLAKLFNMTEQDPVIIEALDRLYSPKYEEYRKQRAQKLKDIKEITKTV